MLQYDVTFEREAALLAGLDAVINFAVTEPGSLGSKGDEDLQDIVRKMVRDPASHRDVPTPTYQVSSLHLCPDSTRSPCS